MDVNLMDDGGRNALDFAEDNMFGHDETIAKLLTEKGVVSQTVNCLNDEKVENDVTSGHIVEMLAGAIVDSDVKFVRLLTQTGTDISTVTWGEGGWNALHIASTVAKTTEILDVILETGKFDINGNNSLHYAKYNKHGLSDGIANRLKEKGAISVEEEIFQDNLLDEYSGEETNDENMVMAVLNMAIVDSNMVMVRFLIETGADISTVTWGEEGWNALHAASIGATKTELLDVILATGQFNINDADVNGETALHLAVGASNIITARYLLEKGADPSIRDIFYINSFHLAAMFSKNSDILDLLLAYEKTINIDERNNAVGMTGSCGKKRFKT
ncbi:hypothetical protein DAPPUDRAFT_114255 [Daphnia pulex]|uniref:Uncharacterized protein n=1 Tax=Daphnia pulex TaxID=6669 RepID=E9HHJ7_DAPPU|nr:hypothetical protein DAPPUDRAFT_114255 [Daphnia pulex]|eukprot:EFX68804.1 hypothetical protein DAPPUDRAFT_114255 [Daphnia pulex]